MCFFYLFISHSCMQLPVFRDYTYQQFLQCCAAWSTTFISPLFVLPQCNYFFIWWASKSVDSERVDLHNLVNPNAKMFPPLDSLSIKVVVSNYLIKSVTTIHWFIKGRWLLPLHKQSRWKWKQASLTSCLYTDMSICRFHFCNICFLDDARDL